MGVNQGWFGRVQKISPSPDFIPRLSSPQRVTVSTTLFLNNGSSENPCTIKLRKAIKWYISRITAYYGPPVCSLLSSIKKKKKAHAY
jgi:hypothetical protein